MRRMGAGTRWRLTGACNMLIAVAAILVIAAVHWPWFLATQVPDLAGEVQAPDGPATGLYAHPSLWVAVGVAAVQLVLLLAHYYPGGRLRVPGDGVFLALGSGLACLIVAVDFIAIPGPWADILSHNGTWAVPFPWEDKPYVLDGCTLLMTWSYGGPVAGAAALTSLIAAIASPGPPATPPGENPDGYFSPASGDSLQETAAD
jgi:hypothetical protein